MRHTLLQLSKKVTKPTKPQLNLQAIYEGIQDLPAVHIRKEVQEVCQRGFSFRTDRSQWYSFRKNKRITQSAQQQPQKIHKHFIKELKQGRIYCDNNFDAKVYIPLFVKPERDKDRIINDFSEQYNGISVNLITPKHVATVELPTITDLVNFLDNDGHNHWAGKNDGESFFRQIPLAQDEWCLAVYWWCGNQYIDTRMPWGARRSARVAHYFSLAITHICNKYIPRSLHPYVLNYVDDHIFRGQTQLECLYVHVTYIAVCEYLSVKLKQQKTKLAQQQIVALGIEFDLTPNKRTADVEQYKQAKYETNIQKFLDSDHHTTQQGQNLAGQLEYIAPLKWPLKCYIRALHNAIPHTTDPNTPLQMTPALKQSLQAWQTAISLLSPTPLAQITNPPKTFDMEIVTDSSDVGYGWVQGTHWAFGAFHKDEVDPNDTHNIRERELYPIAVALTVVAPTARDKHILIWSDNDNAVRALTKKDIRNQDSQEIVIKICELAMQFGFRFYIEHIKGDANIYADALSRLRIPLFLSLCKTSDKTIDLQPTPHPRLPIKLGPNKHTQHAEITIEKKKCKIQHNLWIHRIQPTIPMVISITTCPENANEIDQTNSIYD